LPHHFNPLGSLEFDQKEVLEFADHAIHFHQAFVGDDVEDGMMEDGMMEDGVAGGFRGSMAGWLDE